VSSDLASCTDARLFCAVFRYARQTFAAWPGDLVAIASFLAFLARRRSWVFCAPRRFAPANGCRAVSGVPGPRVVSLAARPTRLIFVELTDRLVEKALGKKAVGRGLSLLRDVRLLGFAPVCDPYPAAPIESIGATGTILPQALPLAGLSGA